MDGIDKQKKYFEMLVDVIDTPIYTTKNWRKGNSYQPGKQIKIGGQLPPIDHRTVGSNELLLELDAATYKQNREFSKVITDYLDVKKIPYYCFWSGNKSIHIHIFLKIDIEGDLLVQLVKKAIDKGCNLYKEIRLSFTREILEQCGLPLNLIGHGKVVDLAKLSWNDLEGKATLIRCCGGANIKADALGNFNKAWKQYYEVLPVNKPRKQVNFDEVDYPLTIEMYDLPKKYIAQAAKRYLDKLTPRTERAFRSVKFKGKYLGNPCISKLLEQTPAGIRNQGAKIVSIAARMDGLTVDEARPILKEFVRNCEQLPEPYELDEAERWLEWVYKQTKPFWNCAFAQQVGVCSTLGCGYFEEKHKSELTLFRSPDPLKVVKEVLDELVEGETMLKMTLFLLYLTKEFDPEWCVLLDGAAASGKSHIMKAVASLFGEEGQAYFTYSRLTTASLNHMDVLAEKWKGNIVIIEELQGARNVVEQLRVAISEGKLTLLETVEDKINGGHLTSTKEIDFTGTLFVTCNAEDFDEGEQLKSRAWILNTDQTKAQNKAVVGRYLEGFNTTEKKRNVHIDELREALGVLEKPDAVVFPESMGLSDFMPTETIRSRRDVKKMISLIKSSAYFHQKNRKWVRGDQNVLYADWRDVSVAYGFAGEIFNASTQGIGARDLEFYDKIINRIVHVPLFTIADVCDWCDVSTPTARKIMSNLCQAGFFSNTQPKGNSALYEKTSLSPRHSSDIIEFCETKIGEMEKK